MYKLPISSASSMPTPVRIPNITEVVNGITQEIPSEVWETFKTTALSNQFGFATEVIERHQQDMGNEIAQALNRLRERANQINARGDEISAIEFTFQFESSIAERNITCELTMKNSGLDYRVTTTPMNNMPIEITTEKTEAQPEGINELIALVDEGKAPENMPAGMVKKIEHIVADHENWLDLKINGLSYESRTLPLFKINIQTTITHYSISEAPAIGNAIGQLSILDASQASKDVSSPVPQAPIKLHTLSSVQKGVYGLEENSFFWSRSGALNTEESWPQNRVDLGG